jgi:hypothetical protein
MRSRIQLTDTAMSAAMKMSDGNPGALTVCALMLREGGTIDPDDFAGGLGSLLSMDTLRLYGPRIWMLYKDVCKEDLRVACALLRAWQLGFVSDSQLRDAIENYGNGIDVPSLVKQVEERLPNFQRDTRQPPVPAPPSAPSVSTAPPDSPESM